MNLPGTIVVISNRLAGDGKSLALLADAQEESSRRWVTVDCADEQTLTAARRADISRFPRTNYSGSPIRRRRKDTKRRALARAGPSFDFLKFPTRPRGRRAIGRVASIRWQP